MYKPEVKAAIIRVAGDIAVEYTRQFPSSFPEKDLPMQLDSVTKCFKHAYDDLCGIVGTDEIDERTYR